MRLAFEPQAFADLQYWLQHQPKLAKKALRMIEESRRDPFGGIGKPEPLKNALSGWWSKRIDGEHRLVYRVDEDSLVILQLRGHYGDH
ncbi:Txe/YoeB family addiction module toxin [Haloferula chungangensis]|uniref:Putative mRNA interferase YoeB n=1 Tax=Haloferula chungangensis TaxID=1048331 RepID=A0ABW2L980_9BACT